MFNDLHDHEWGGLPLMDGQAIPAGGVCGAFTVEAVRKTADGPADESYQVLDCEGKPVHKGDKLIEPLDGDGVVLEVFTGGTDGEVYAEWGNGTKTVVWGSEVCVASRRTAFNMGDYVTFSNGRHRPELALIREQKTDVDGNTQALIRFESDGEEEWVPFAMLSDGAPERDYDAVAASRRTALTPISRDRYDTSESTSPVEWGEDLLGAVSIPGSGNVVRDTQRPPGAIDTGSWSIGDRVETGNGTGVIDGVYEDRGYALVNMDDGEAVQFPFGWLRKTAISGDVSGEEVSDAREDDARVMQSARLTEADSAYIMAGVATKHGDLGTFVRSASRNPAVYLRQAVYDTHGFTPTVREAMALWQWASKRVKAEDDPTEDIRRNMVDEFKSNPNERAQLEAQYGQVWDTNALQNDFEVLGFMAPFVVVKRKATGEKGSLMFQSNPRLYFGWAPD